MDMIFKEEEELEETEDEDWEEEEWKKHNVLFNFHFCQGI
jgi:hypothetical protein